MTPALALCGGTPVRTAPFPRWPQHDETERRALMEALDAGSWGGYPFPNRMAERFCAAFARVQTVRHALAVANGTVAIETALRACGLAPGDEVIVPAYTFEATAVPVLRLGGVPVFVDVRSDTYCIDPAAAEAAVTPRTRVLLPVHLAMGMADMDAMTALAERHRLRVVEDCAHAHGARWRGRGAGSIGDAGAFSMQTSKLLTAGEGGAVTTNDDELLERMETYVNCGRASRTDRFAHRLVGVNYRMTEFQAAVLLTQLERLPAQTSLRNARAERLSAGLSGVEGVSLLRRDPRQDARAIYQFVFKYEAAAFEGSPRDRFAAALEAEGIPCDGRFYEPVYRSPLFQIDPREFSQLEGKPLPAVSCPVAERAAYEEAIWLPHPLLLGTDRDVDDIVEAVAKIQRHPGELLKAEHPLIDVKRRSRAARSSLTL